MAALSDFGYIKRSNRQQLLSRLVCKILNVQPGDDNHELALEYCLHNVDFHRYGDTSPNSVDEEYDSLQARMGVNAQFGKQRALQQLRTLFLQQPLSRDTLEIHHRVLSALLTLSRRPLKHPYTAPSFLTRPAPESSLYPGDSEDAGSEVSELSAWDGDVIGPDELSDWSDDGTDLIRAASPTEPASAAPAIRAPVSPTKPSWQRLSDSWEAGKVGKVRLQPAHAADSPAYGDGCLLQLLAATRGRGVPFITPSARLFFTEQDLVFQVLHMLQGSPSPGRALTLKPDLDLYEVTAGAHVAHLSPGCLQNMLNRFTGSGTISYRLNMFVRGVRAAATMPSHARTPTVAPTLAAFAAALADELAAVQSALMGVQEDFAAHARAGGNSGEDVGLIALEAAVKAPMRRLRLLEAVMSALDVGKPGASSAASQAAALLDGLHTLLGSLAADATPPGRAEVAVVLRLLLRSARPLLDALDAWLEHGLLTDSKEFFICSGADVPVEDASFWHGGGFQLRKGTDGSIVCPSFLRPLVGDILSAGKSVLLLRARQLQYSRSAPALPAAEVGALGRLPLHNDILQRLQHAVSSEELPEAGAASIQSTSDGSLAERMAATNAYHLASSCSRLNAGALAAERAADAFSAAACRAAAMQRLPGHADVIGRPLRLPGERGSGLSRHLAGKAGVRGEAGGYAYSASSPSGLPTPTGVSQRTISMQRSLTAAPRWSADGHMSGAAVRQTAVEAGEGAARKGSTRSERLVESSSCRVLEERGNPLGGRTDVSGVLGDVSNLSLSARKNARANLPRKDSSATRAAHPGCADERQRPDGVPFAGAPADLSTISGTDEGLKDWYMRMLEAMRKPTGLLDAETCRATKAPFGGRENCHVPAHVQATLINAFSGKAVQQMWGAKWKQHEADDGGLNTWLLALRDPDLPLVDVAIQECLLAPIQERVERIGRQLLGSLMGSWGLRQELTALQNVYLLASPAMQPFADSLFALLAEQGDKPLEATGAQLFELQGHLEQCLSDEQHGHLLPAHAVTLDIRGTGAAPEKWNTIAALHPLRLKLQLPWPLSLVVQERHVEQYNDVLTFLLQMSWVRAALQGLRDIGSPAARGIDACDGLCWQMTHFATHLHGFVLDCLMHTVVPQLTQALEAARTLDDVAAAHDEFLEAAARAAMVAKDRTCLLVLQAVTKLLDLALRFADVAKGAAAATDDIAEIGRVWQDRHRYLMRLLTARTLRSGGFASLEQLAAHLDFNRFYCS